MIPMKQRLLMRNTHLICSGLLGWALYGGSDFAMVISQWAVFPVLALSGLWMWKQGAIVRWFKNRAATQQ